MELGNGVAKNRILDAFYAILRNSIQESTLAPRIDEYAAAVTTPHPQGPAWTVGRAFAGFLSPNVDLQLMMSGSFVFASSRDVVSAVLRDASRLSAI